MSENQITLSDMSAPAKARKAARLASMPESQAESAASAIAQADTTHAERPPEKRKRTVSALAKAIESNDQLIERTEQRLATAKERKEFESVLGWEKSLKNAIERRAALIRLKTAEETHID